MDTTEQEQQSNSTMHQFCSFCLCARLPNVEFYEQIVVDSDDLQTSLQSLLGYDFRLENFTICKPCWKIAQLFQDFRLRCLKANGVVAHIGLGLESKDDWFSARNLATIESIRVLVKGQLQEIEKLSKYASESVITTENESKDAVEEAFESTFDICEIKIETDDDTGNLQDEVESRSEVEDNELVDPLSNRKPTPRIYQCSLCGVQLDRRLKMSEHYKLVHPGEPRFLCSMCDKRFKTKGQLQRHEKRVHSGDRPKALSCEQCGKTFAEKWYLTVHRRRHNPDGLPFYCKECGKLFSSKYALDMHCARKHPELASPTDRANLAKLDERRLLRYKTKRTEWSENECDSE